MVRQGGLGKGLGALIPSEVSETASVSGAELLEIPVGAIVPNPSQPRRDVPACRGWHVRGPGSDMG